MKKYASYKDSGIEWIGEIPSHWEVKRLKYVSTINDDTLSDKTEDGLEVEYVDISSIESGVGISKTESFNFKEAPSRARRLVKDGDIIVSTVRTYLKAIAKIENPKPNLVVSTGFAVIRPRDILPDYAGHLFYHENLLGEIVSRSVGVSYPAINSSEIGTIKIPLPKKSEQTAIATYLDRKTAEIDELIANKKRLLELYEEEKTAIINELVTGKKVWNGQAWTEPVEVKDSGIEWLGKIPGHWEVKRFKYFFNLITEKVEEDMPKTGLENIESKSGKFTETNTDFAGQGVRFRPKDILFGKLRPYLAKVWLSNFDGQAVGDFYVFRSKQEVHPEFAKYRILDSSFIEITNSSTYGSKMPRVSWEFIADLPIAFPNIQEQQAIVNHIETECARIEAKKTKTEKLIELLTEYRTALISEVVMGKVKVIEGGE